MSGMKPLSVGTWDEFPDKRYDKGRGTVVSLCCRVRQAFGSNFRANRTRFYYLKSITSELK